MGETINANPLELMAVAENMQNQMEKQGLDPLKYSKELSAICMEYFNKPKIRKLKVKELINKVKK